MASPKSEHHPGAASENHKAVTINDAIAKLHLPNGDRVDLDCFAGNTTVPSPHGGAADRTARPPPRLSRILVECQRRDQAPELAQQLGRIAREIGLDPRVGDQLGSRIVSDGGYAAGTVPSAGGYYMQANPAGLIPSVQVADSFVISPFC